METKQDLNVDGTVIPDGEYSECQLGMSFVVENLYLVFEVCAFLEGILRLTDVSGQPFGPNWLSRNVGKKLPFCAT